MTPSNAAVGKVGKQKRWMKAPWLLPKHGWPADICVRVGKKQQGKDDMETFRRGDGRPSKEFMDKAKKDGKPVFIWHNTTRMQVFTYIYPKYQAMMSPRTTTGGRKAEWPSWMTDVGQSYSIWKNRKQAENTIVIFTTATAQKYSLEDGGMRRLNPLRAPYRRWLPRARRSSLRDTLSPASENGIYQVLMVSHSRGCCQAI